MSGSSGRCCSLQSAWPHNKLHGPWHKIPADGAFASRKVFPRTLDQRYILVVLQPASGSLRLVGAGCVSEPLPRRADSVPFFFRVSWLPQSSRLPNRLVASHRRVLIGKEEPLLESW